MVVFLLKWDKTIHKGMSLEGSKCIKIKRPAHLSIVERLGGYWCYKGTKIFRNLQFFGEKF